MAPDAKKVIRDFSFTVIMLVIDLTFKIFNEISFYVFLTENYSNSLWVNLYQLDKDFIHYFGDIMSNSSPELSDLLLELILKKLLSVYAFPLYHNISVQPTFKVNCIICTVEKNVKSSYSKGETNLHQLFVFNCLHM